MRRGAPPAGFTGWGSGAPFFRASAFVSRLFAPLPFRFCPHALTLPLEHMRSHVFPWALT